MPGRALIKATTLFARRAARVLDEGELGELYAFLSANPDAGDIVGGAGGVRKLRWGMGSGGKRGGARILHLHLKHRSTVWLLDVYAKREKANLNAADLKAIRALVAAIKQQE